MECKRAAAPPPFPLFIRTSSALAGPLPRLTAGAPRWLLLPAATPAFGARRLLRRLLPWFAAASGGGARLLSTTAATVSAGRPRLTATTALSVHLLSRLAPTTTLIQV
jgi:hypothetical protein